MCMCMANVLKCLYCQILFYCGLFRKRHSISICMIYWLLKYDLTWLDCKEQKRWRDTKCRMKCHMLGYSNWKDKTWKKKNIEKRIGISTVHNNTNQTSNSAAKLKKGAPLFSILNQEGCTPFPCKDQTGNIWHLKWKYWKGVELDLMRTFENKK